MWTSVHSALASHALLLCHFNGCLNPVMRHGSRKCHFHRKRGICAVLTCRSQVNKRGVCLAHGARSDPCNMPGCSMSARTRGLCHRHAKEKPMPRNSRPVPTMKGVGSLETFDDLAFKFASILSDQYIDDVPVALSTWPEYLSVEGIAI
ncbi:Aste57867_12324 [Aphanomyces stellatus]|uniref:Aste57867_12324 protein n=1 Tax=Aphanomyces stellatus TaxID=120398 RepID=A0A485KVV9_9STRA|nr:hypothetical protein As57867_012278 [Aphanomyces stellatus]VFT89176.1 Aste57867_12324 [Aphanomyces stellatus]